MHQDEVAVQIVPRSSPADAICGNSVDSRTLIPHEPPSTRLPVYGRIRVPFERVNPSRTHPFTKQAERSMDGTETVATGRRPVANGNGSEPKIPPSNAGTLSF
jgi:hypothetical protein